VFIGYTGLKTTRGSPPRPAAAPRGPPPRSDDDGSVGAGAEGLGRLRWRREVELVVAREAHGELQLIEVVGALRAVHVPADRAGGTRLPTEELAEGQLFLKNQNLRHTKST
jgi:hypothetical protein